MMFRYLLQPQVQSLLFRRQQLRRLLLDPSDPSGNTVFVGGASGGVWKTTNFLTTDVASMGYADGMAFCRDLPPGQGLPIQRLLDRTRRLVLLSEERDLRQMPAAAASSAASKGMPISRGLPALNNHSSDAMIQVIKGIAPKSGVKAGMLPLPPCISTR